MSVVSLTTEQWTDRIRRKLAATVEQIIEVGNDLEAAKSQLGGRWLKVLEGCDMDKRTAQRFMSIAAHPVLANTTTWSYLPASYRTLSELARFDEVILERAIRDGEVTRETRTRDAEEMYQRYYGTSTTTTSRETTTTTHTHPAVDRPVSAMADTGLADENGEPLPTSGSEGREAEGGADDAPTSGTDRGEEDGPGRSAPPPPAEVDPAVKNRAVIDSALVVLCNARRDLDAARVEDFATAHQRSLIASNVLATREWCDAVEAVLEARPKLQVV